MVGKPDVGQKRAWGNVNSRKGKIFMSAKKP
jgi:hypothetical protein